MSAAHSHYRLFQPDLTKAYGMDLAEIRAQIEKHWEPGFGPIAPEEALFIRDQIQKRRPECYVEIGVASGISTGLTTAFLEDVGARRLLGVDINPTFLKAPTGRKANLICKPKSVQVQIRTPHDSLDVPELIAGEAIDMAFIDGNHQHPWPLIDLMALLPHLSPGAVVMFHDLELYKKYADSSKGIGPKYLFDAFPERVRHRGTLDNIFAITIEDSIAALEGCLVDCLALPWTLQEPLSLRQASKLDRLLECSYSEAFRKQCDRFWRRYWTKS